MTVVVCSVVLIIAAVALSVALLFNMPAIGLIALCAIIVASTITAFR